MKTTHKLGRESGGFSRRSPRLIVAAALAVVLLSSCAGVQVSQDYDTGYGFDKNRSYGWKTTPSYPDGDLLQGDELLAKRFKKAIETTLALRGFVTAVQPTYLVSCTYTVTSRLENEVFDSGFGFGFGRYGRYGSYGGVGMSTGTGVRQYDQGTLVITVHSAATNQVIWKGTGTREVFQHASPNEMTSHVNDMVTAVLAQFPPIK